MSRVPLESDDEEVVHESDQHTANEQRRKEEQPAERARREEQRLRKIGALELAVATALIHSRPAARKKLMMAGVTDDPGYVAWRRQLENEKLLFEIGARATRHSCCNRDTVALPGAKCPLFGCTQCGRVHACSGDEGGAKCPLMCGPQTDFAYICIFSGRYVGPARSILGIYELEVAAQRGENGVLGANASARAQTTSSRTYTNRANAFSSTATRNREYRRADNARQLQHSVQVIKRLNADMKRAHGDGEEQHHQQQQQQRGQKRKRDDHVLGSGGGDFDNDDDDDDNDADRDDANASAMVATGLSCVEEERDLVWPAQQWQCMHEVFDDVAETLAVSRATAAAATALPVSVPPPPSLPPKLAFLSADEEAAMRQSVRVAVDTVVNALRSMYTAVPSRIIPLPCVYTNVCVNMALILRRALTQQTELYRFVVLVLLQLLVQDRTARDHYGCPIVVWSADPWLSYMVGRHRANAALDTPPLPTTLGKVVQNMLRTATSALGREVNKCAAELLGTFRSATALRTALFEGLVLSNGALQ